MTAIDPNFLGPMFLDGSGLLFEAKELERGVASVELPTEHTIQPKVQKELGFLAAAGLDVKIASTDNGVALEQDVQSRVTDAISTLESRHPVHGMVPVLMDNETHPTSHVWYSLRKRAIALTPLYNPYGSHLGTGVDPDVYDEPLFNGQSAMAILQKDKPDAAVKIRDRYETFIRQPLEDGSAGSDEFGLSSADYIAGVPDAIAVRLRANTASTMVLDHALERKDSSGTEPFNITSLACGAAGPMFTMVPTLQEHGVTIGNIRLVDWDVMALATAKSLADSEGLSEKISLERFDLLRGDLADVVHDADVVDLLGLFEYFSRSIGAGPARYDLAANFLRQVGRGMKPGSAIIFGNMLDERHHQTMFNQVWPSLYQRSLSDVVALAKQAGFPQESLEIQVPQDGVYGVYKLTIPEEGLALRADTLRERAAKNLAFILDKIKEY